jgi:hypothetical protein
MCAAARRIDGVVEPVWNRFHAALYEHPLHNGQLWHGAQDLRKGSA